MGEILISQQGVQEEKVAIASEGQTGSVSIPVSGQTAQIYVCAYANEPGEPALLNISYPRLNGARVRLGEVTLARGGQLEIPIDPLALEPFKLTVYNLLSCFKT